MSVLLRRRRARLGALASTSFLAGLAEAAFLVVVTRAAFAITNGSDKVELLGEFAISIGWAAMLCLALVVLRVGLAFAGSFQTADLVSGAVADTRRDLSSAFLFATWKTQHEDRGGELQELLTTFIRQCAILLNSVTQMVASAFSLIALLGTAIVVDPVSAVVLLASVAVLGALLRPLRRAVKRRSTHMSGTGMQFATSLNEIAQLGMEVHIFHVQAEAEARVGDLIKRNREAERRVIFATTMVAPIYIGLAYAAIVGALLFVSASEATEMTSIGAVMLVMLRSLTYGQALQSSHATVLAGVPFIQTLQAKLTRYRRNRLLDTGEAIGDIGELRLESVDFAYVPGQPVLTDISAVIAPGEMIGIIGPSGGGKSTLVQLLLGLRLPDSGEILADGRPISSLSREEWARRVTFVPQDAHLFSGTVSDNIRFMRPDTSDAQLQRAAEMAHIAEDIARFDDGFQHQVGEGGGQLSGGQQQRLCIARALVEEPDVLILDEPTSALDPRSEHLIRETLLELKGHMTIIIIAHRISTLDSCSRIMVIQGGQIQGFDTPKRLAETNAFYRDALSLARLT